MIGRRNAKIRRFVADGVQTPLVLHRENGCHRVLVVSDLHLGCGRDPVTRRYRRRENFFADDAFRRFLEYFAQDDAGPGLLVLNGDIIDFVRVICVPRTNEDFDEWSRILADLGCKKKPDELRLFTGFEKRQFGLGTREFESAWRIYQVVTGHPDFFNALSGWLKRGGRIVFVMGNHDIEIRWPLVQSIIVRAIVSDWADLGDRVTFVPQSAMIENLYFEHGHLFESATTVPVAETMTNGGELRLPLASLVNRYLINKLEGMEPFLDNMKPICRALPSILLRHPLQFLGRSLLAAPFVIRSVRPFWLSHGVGIMVFFGALALSLAAVGFLTLAVLSSMLGARVVVSRFNPLSFQVLLTAIALLGIIELVRRMKKKQRFRIAEDNYGKGLMERLQAIEFPLGAEVAYGVIGHTHRPDAQFPPFDGDHQYVYLNSGTWAPVWRRDRPNLRGGTEFSFLRFDWDPEKSEFRHSSLVWRDDRNAPVESLILARD